MRIFGSLGFFLKKSTVVEELAKIDTIVFDKTGTITRAEVHDINWNGLQLSTFELALLGTVTRNSTHPLSQAICQTIEPDKTLQLDDFKELASRGIIGKVGTNEIRVGSEEFISGLSTPATINAGSRVYVSINGELKGHYTIGNSYRTGIDQVIDSLKNKFELHMISGDNNSEKERLKKWFNPANMHFDCSPNDKLEYIKSLKNQGKRVLMIGDGLNDAGALAESNAGISIADDVYMFSPACDAILESNMFKNLHTILKIAQKNLKVVHISFIISLSYNIIGLGFATQGMLSPVVAAILMPISSVTVVGFVTLATNYIGKQLTK
jgi:Cu+-exporting ATPase